jgi:hypothetical protein
MVRASLIVLDHYWVVWRIDIILAMLQEHSADSFSILEYNLKYWLPLEGAGAVRRLREESGFHITPSGTSCHLPLEGELLDSFGSLLE